jgi:hypothetical protein
VARWRERDGRAHAAPLYRALGRWAGGVVEVLRAARPEIPDELSDRAQDVWEPLLAIADWAGGDWPVRARRAAVALMGSIEDTDITVELLRDVQHILTDITEPVVKTEALITALVALDDRPWATWRKGEKPITPHGLARLLKPLGVHPDRHFRTVRGYRVDAFGDAIARYVSVRTSQCHVANETGLGSRDGCDPASPPENATVTQVPPANIEDVTIRRFDSGSDAGPVIDVVPEGADDDDAIRY